MPGVNGTVTIQCILTHVFFFFIVEFRMIDIYTKRVIGLFELLSNEGNCDVIHVIKAVEYFFPNVSQPLHEF